jgi:hypothetical protein
MSERASSSDSKAMAAPLSSSSAPTSTQQLQLQSKDVSFHRPRAHVVAGLYTGQASNIKPVKRSHLSFSSLSRGDVSQCRLSEFSRLHLGPRDLPESSAIEKEKYVALKVRSCL